MIQGLIEKLHARSKSTPLMAELLTTAVNNLIASSGEKLVIRKKVRELLFEGYHVRLFEKIAQDASQFGINIPSPLPNNTFGALYNKNGTSPGRFVINTGTRNIMDLGQIASFKSRS